MKTEFTLVKKKIIVMPVIKGITGEKEVHFILDTGASITIIGEETAILLGFDVNKLRRDNLTAIGGRVSAKLLKLPEFELFGKSVKNFEVNVMSLPIQIRLLADGIVGMDFLLNFKTFKIDFETTEIDTTFDYF